MERDVNRWQWILLTVAFLCAWPGSAGAQGTVAGDRAALTSLYDATGGSDWKYSTSWLTDAPLRDWYGIETDANGRVAIVSLTRNGLTGEVPSDLGDLDRLEELWLTANGLNGEIPAELGALANLEVLSLAVNRLTGSIPTALGNLTNIEQLNLNDNRLSGSIPTELENLSSLVDFSLSGNGLGDSIPPGLGDLSGLKWLTLGRNDLTGAIPDELGRLPHLLRLWLDGNRFSESVPPALGGLTSLIDLNLAGNELSGAVPDELVNLLSLESLYLNDNRALSGSLPLNLMFLSDLGSVDIRNTGLCGPEDGPFRTWAATIDFRGCGGPTPPSAPPGGGGGPPPGDDGEDEDDDDDGGPPPPPPPPPPPTVSVSFGSSGYAVSEGGSVDVVVRLDRDPQRTLRIPLVVGHLGGATAADYSGVPASIRLSGGVTTGEFEFAATDDGDEDFGESVVLDFGALPSGVSGVGQATVSIGDDDTPPIAVIAVAGADCGSGLCRALTGVPVRLVDESTGPVELRRWTFGDGVESGLRTLDHSWSEPGFYEVRLWVSDGSRESVSLRTFLVESSDPVGSCTSDVETLCLQDSRYAVSVDWWEGDGAGGRGIVVHAGTNDSGLFRFFNRENWEVLIKVLDGCAVNRHVWVYGASTTDLGYLIRVTDTVTGTEKEYLNEPGTPAPAITDAKAFHTCAR